MTSPKAEKHVGSQPVKKEPAKAPESKQGLTKQEQKPRAPDQKPPGAGPGGKKEERNEKIYVAAV